VGAAHRLEAGDADGGNAQRQRQATCRRHADADAREVAGTHADGDGVERVERQPVLGQHLLDQRHEAFGLSLRHRLVALREDPVATQQSGRAMRGRCVEAQDEGLRR
jgi:hypothetical protein